MSIDLRTAKAGFTQSSSRFRLDFGNQPANRIRVRKLTLVEDRQAFANLAGTNDVSLELNPDQVNQLENCALREGGFVATTTGNDPFVSCRPVQENYDHQGIYILRFEYQAEKNSGEFECYFVPPFDQQNRVTPRRLSYQAGSNRDDPLRDGIRTTTASSWWQNTSVLPIL